MNTLKRALGNSSILMVSQLITWTSSLYLTSQLGTYLGDDGFGYLYLAMSFAVVFSIFVDFGLDQQLTRAVARDRDKLSVYLCNSLALKMVLSVVAYGIILGLIHLLGYPDELKQTIAVFSLILIFHGVCSSLGAASQAFEKVFYPTLALTLEKVAICVGAVFLLRQGYGATPVAAVYVAATFGNAVFQVAMLRKIAPVRFALDVRMMPAILRGGVAFFLFAALASVYFRIDTVLLGQMAPAEVLGWYGAAYRLFDTLVFLPSIVSTIIMYPILSRLSAESHAEMRRAVAKGLQAMIVLGLPICTGLFLLAEPIIRFIYRRPEFMPAATVLQWLAFALFLLYVNHMLVVVIWSLNREKRMTVVAAIAIVLNLGLNILLIPRYQHVGSAAVTVVTELFLTVSVFLVVPRDVLSRSSLGVFGRAAMASAAMGLVVWAVREQSLFLVVPLGGLVYGIAALLFGAVPAEDVRLFRQVISVRRRGAAAQPEASRA